MTNQLPLPLDTPTPEPLYGCGSRYCCREAVHPADRIFWAKTEHEVCWTCKDCLPYGGDVISVGERLDHFLKRKAEAEKESHD